MKKRNSLLSLVLAVCLCFMLAVPALAAEDEVVQAMNQYIDDDIVDSEREIMQDVLLLLEPEDRENVVYFAEDGNVYSNKQELKNDIVTYKINEEGNFENTFGEEVASPFVESLSDYETILADYLQDSIRPMAAESGKGPYRRVSSSKGYSWASARLTLPANNNIYVPNGGVLHKDDPVNFQKDVPYAYLGGSCTNGSEVDAGMMYNGGQQNWSLFIAPDSKELSTTDETRFKSGQTVFLKYYAIANNKVAISVDGILDGTNTKKNLVFVTENANGWNTSGQNCIIKHVVSMAQGDWENFHSGAYIRGVKWSDMYIGTSSTKNSAWTSGTAYTYPKDKSGFDITYIDAGNETVSINLQ